MTTPPPVTPETAILTAGRNASAHHGAVNVPPYRAATVLFDTCEAFDAAMRGTDIYGDRPDAPGVDFSYGAGGTPVTRALEDGINALENANHTLIYPSGLAAITVTLLTLLKTGDAILLPDSVYGPARRFCVSELKRYGVETVFYDPCAAPEEVAARIAANTKILFIESPGSLTFEVQDTRALCALAKERGLITIADNSWATGLYFRPLDHGADISLQACTKYIGGHADVLLGAVSVKETALYRELCRGYRNTGACPSGDDCYLALRGLRTTAVRLKQHGASALAIAEKLERHDKISEVFFPALPSHKSHALWKRDFNGGAGGLISFRLAPDITKETLYAAINRMRLFGIGASWGGYESLILTFSPATARSVLTYAPGMYVRLFIGLEAPEDLFADIENLLNRL